MFVNFRLSIILFISIPVLLGGCGNKSASKVGCEEVFVDSIQVFYYNYSFMSPLAIKCEDIKKDEKPTFKKVFNATKQKYYIEYEGVIDTVIRDKDVLSKIEMELSNLKSKDSLSSLDARISCIIYFNDGTIEDLCICQDPDTKYIYRNGVSQDFNHQLVYLIKMYSGYYSWFSRNNLKHMEELGDSTIVRDSIEITFENNPRLQICS